MRIGVQILLLAVVVQGHVFAQEGRKRETGPFDLIRLAPKTSAKLTAAALLKGTDLRRGTGGEGSESPGWSIADPTRDTYVISQLVSGGSDVLRFSTQIAGQVGGSKAANVTVSTFNSDGSPMVLEYEGLPGGGVSGFEVVLDPEANLSKTTVPTGFNVGYAVIQVDKGTPADFSVVYRAREPQAGNVLSSIVSIPAIKVTKDRNIYKTEIRVKETGEDSTSVDTGLALVNPQAEILEGWYEFRPTAGGDPTIEGFWSLNPGQHLAQFVTEIETLDQPIPDDFEGNLVVFSDQPFAAVPLLVEGLKVSSLNASNNFPAARTVIGRITHEDKPVSGLEVSLVHADYERPSGERVPMVVCTKTGVDGGYSLDLPGYTQGFLEVRVDHPDFYRMNVPVQAVERVTSLDDLRLMERWTDTDGTDKLDLVREIGRADGSPEVNGNTRIFGFPIKPIPFQVYTFLEDGPESYEGEEQDMYDQAVPGIEIVAAASGNNINIQDELPSRSSLGIIGPDGPYGVKVRYLNRIGVSRLRRLAFDENGKTTYAELELSYLRDPNKRPGRREKRLAQHESLHAVTFSGHSPRTDKDYTSEGFSSLRTPMSRADLEVVRAISKELAPGVDLAYYQK